MLSADSAVPTQAPPMPLIQMMNEEHADDVLLYAQVYGKQTSARQARIIHLDCEGMELEVTLGSGSPKRLNIRFSAPLENLSEAEHALEELTRRAEKLAGHNSREVVGRFISKFIRRWTG